MGSIKKGTKKINEMENDFTGMKSVGTSLGPKPIRIVIDGASISEFKDIILRNISLVDGEAKLNYYEATNKIVGTVSEYKLDTIKRELKSIDPTLNLVKKPIIKENTKRFIKITKEQYNRLFASGALNEEIVKGGLNRVDKSFKQSFGNLKEDDNSLKKEVIELIKYLYRKSDNFSNYWVEKNLTYDDICDVLLSKNMIIEKNGKFEISKKLGTPDEALNAIQNELSKLIEVKPELEKEDISNYAPGTENDPNSPWNQIEPETTEKTQVKDKNLKLLAFNYDIALLKDKNGKLYAFYYNDINKNDFSDYANVPKKYIGKDEDGNSDYEYGEFEIDGNVIEDYVNHNLSKIKKGDGLKAWENGSADLIAIDDNLKNELLSIYDKDKDITKALNTLEEMTSASSSGAFTGLLNNPVIKKEMPNDTNNLDTPIVGETTSVTAGNFKYDANALPNIDRDGTFKKGNKTKAEKNTQYPDGSFVNFNDCTKLNNKPAGSGCSQGAVDNVVKLTKTKNNINAPSLNESLKLQHNKNDKKLIVISDLEGKEASKETFINKNVLKQNGFQWNGTHWVIDVDKLEIAKKTLSLINKADYIVNTLEELENAVEDSGADNKSLLKAKLEQYVLDLANATDEAALSAEIRRYLTFFSKFHNYSFYNRLLIFIQKPEAKQVASYKKWQEKFRQVKKGAKAISVLAPIISKTKSDDEDDEIKKDIRGFRAVNVFDISDTEPIDSRGEAPEELQWWGDNTPSETADELFGYASEVATNMGIKLTNHDTMRGERGYTKGDHINISSGVSGAGRLSTMIHEIAHELMHFREKSIYYQGDDVQTSKAIKELQAESVSYVVLKHYGLPVSHHTTYLALWKANKEKIQSNLEVISKVSEFIIKKIDEIANKSLNTKEKEVSN